MHPILTQGRRLGLYLFLFSQAGLVLGELLSRTSGAPRSMAMALAVPLVLLHGFQCLASWYLAKSLPLGGARVDLARLGRLLVAWLTAGLTASGVLLAAGAGWAWLLERWLGVAGALALAREGATLGFAFALMLYSVAVAVHYLFGALERSRAAEARAYELRILAREAELRALRSQLDPHFLFNSLNSINGLVGTDPVTARRMCTLLADFLRRTLRLEGSATIPLAEELELVGTYLEIERVRFGERLGVVREVDPAVEHWAVPPLLLQPLVENAVRHGIAHRLEGGTVEIRAEGRSGRLRLVVANPCDRDRPRRRGEGIGLGNVRRRLDAAFGGAATLEIDEREESFRVALSLPASEAAEGAEVAA